MERDSFIFYRSFLDALNVLPEKEQTQVLMALLNYALNGIEVDANSINPIAFGFFSLMKPQIDANNKRFENGKKGGKKPKNQSQNKAKNNPDGNQTQTETKPNSNQNETKKEPKQNQDGTESEANVNVNVNDNVNVNVNVNENEKKTLSESEKEIFEEYVNTLTNDVEYGIWREEIMMKYGIKNFKQAFKDFNCYLIGSTLDSQVKNIEDYKRIFFYNTSKFLSNEAKILAPIPNCQEIKRNGKRYVLQYGEEILLPDNAPPLPTDSLNYYWCTSWNQWRKTY